MTWPTKCRWLWPQCKKKYVDNAQAWRNMTVGIASSVGSRFYCFSYDFSLNDLWAAMRRIRKKLSFSDSLPFLDLATGIFLILSPKLLLKIFHL